MMFSKLDLLRHRSKLNITMELCDLHNVLLNTLIGIKEI